MDTPITTTAAGVRARLLADAIISAYIDEISGRRDRPGDRAGRYGAPAAQATIFSAVIGSEVTRTP
jgi:hypothetical protein